MPDKNRQKFVGSHPEAEKFTLRKTKSSGRAQSTHIRIRTLVYLFSASRGRSPHAPITVFHPFLTFIRVRHKIHARDVLPGKPSGPGFSRYRRQWR